MQVSSSRLYPYTSVRWTPSNPPPGPTVANGVSLAAAMGRRRGTATATPGTVKVGLTQKSQSGRAPAQAPRGRGGAERARRGESAGRSRRRLKSEPGPLRPPARSHRVLDARRRGPAEGPVQGGRRAWACRRVAMTDHGNMFGAYDFYQQATAAGIKPIIGIEAYVAPDSRDNQQAGSAGASRTRSRDDVSGGGALPHMTMLGRERRAACTTSSSSPPAPPPRASTASPAHGPRADRASTPRGSSPPPAARPGEVQTRLRLGQYDEALKAAARLPGHLRQGELLPGADGPRPRHRDPGPRRPAATRAGS